MNTITLQQALPRVFEAEREAQQERSSQVWLTSMAFEKGKAYLVEAESGTGKSSLCSYIYGWRRDYAGQILFDQQDISRLNIGQWCQIRRKSLALLPQEMRIFPELTAMENIRLKNDLTHWLGEEEIMQMLDELGIGLIAQKCVGTLSIGQQQRVAIIRTLCQPFDFLLLDEPVSHLDERNNRKAASLILRHARRQGAGIIATSVGNPLLLESDVNRIRL